MTDTLNRRVAEPQIGDRVRATMNGEDWLTGTYQKNIELFTQYGVLLDDINEVRYFIAVENI
ncbi:MAG: hypothetical protein WC332_00105 [Clostridia bacterium]|jgi:hypothetical protein